MTQEERRLLLNDLCTRLPYGVRVKQGDWEHTLESANMYNGSFDSSCAIPIPYLRPMSSMTREEKKEYESFFSIGEYSCGGSLYGKEYEYIADSPDDISQSICLFDWLIAHHFDYRGLIPMGLALEATEGMYKTE